MARIENHDVLQNAAERAGVFLLLARLWAKEADAELLGRLNTGPLKDAWNRDVPSDEASLDELQLDYCGLFIGPQGHLPPVQSVWEEQRFEGDAAASMRQFFDVLNLDAPYGESLPKDHVANIFAACGHLLLAVPDDEGERLEFADLAWAIFSEHVAWIRDLAIAAGSRAQTDFYREVMAMTERFIASEIDLRR